MYFSKILFSRCSGPNGHGTVVAVVVLVTLERNTKNKQHCAAVAAINCFSDLSENAMINLNV